MTYEVRNLIDSLNENGVHVIANKQFDAFAFDFSEHDKKVAEEKDKKISKLERDLKECKDEVIAVRKNRDEMMESFRNGIKPYVDLGQMHERIAELEKENAELDYMRKSWMETAEKWYKLNKDLQDRIDSFEFAINQTAELQDRHQSDCIEINRLNVALEVIMEKYMKLREVHGL